MNVGSVVILNGDYSFMGFTSWKRAVVLIETKKAEVIKKSEEFIRTMGGKIINIPIVLRLMKFVKVLYKRDVPFTKKNIMIRDNYTCQYCGKKLTDKINTNKDKDFKKMKATIDHLIPVSKGGTSSWENCVCCCFECNNKKDDKKLSETNLKLIRKPVKPTMSQFIEMKLEFLGKKVDLKTLWS